MTEFILNSVPRGRRFKSCQHKLRNLYGTQNAPQLARRVHKAL